MKKQYLIVIIFILVMSLCACSQEEIAMLDTEPISMQENEPIVTTEVVLHSPHLADAYRELDYTQAENVLREAGFTNIELCAVDDITSDSNISDGTVESVTINGSTDYTNETEFDRNTKVVIIYHNIPKIAVPLDSNAATEQYYMDVGKLFFDAGFTNIVTEEVYDLSADSDYETKLTANNQKISSDEKLPFDSPICVRGHYPNPEYQLDLMIDFEENWFLYRYDVAVMLNGRNLGTLPHGEDGSYSASLPAGKYSLAFVSAEDDAVSSNIEINVNSNTTATYHITCERDYVEIKEVEFTQALTSKQVMMPFGADHYLRKDYQNVASELKKLGFNKVRTEPVHDNLWTPSPVNSVVDISIDQASAFKRDSIFAKSAAVTVYYHVADFAFIETLVNVTEKDIFELSYTMTSGDDMDSLTFEIDHPEILQRNADGTFTALMPGSATVTVSSGGHVYSSCTVEVAEIIVPIESVLFEKSELDAVVGSTIVLTYKTLPEEANYTDIAVVISDDGIEHTGEDSFYICKAGDTEITFYQDDRILGTCIVHAKVVDIEELIADEWPEEMFVGDELELWFDLKPEKATSKGIRVTSLRPDVAEVTFDERGEPAIKIQGRAVGSTTITIMLPNGVQYAHNIDIQERLPSEITVTNTSPNTRIEVGTPISLAVTWTPENTSIKELTWSSNNNQVIKVNTDGTLEAVGVGTAEITARHKSGVFGTITLTVEPTAVKKITLTADKDISKDFVKGNTFTILSAIFPENATNKGLAFSSSDTSIVQVSDKGVVTAVGVGTAAITAVSPDGPTGTLKVTVFPAPQKFRITWSAQMISNDHVGYNWRTYFEVNDEPCYYGSIVTVDPGSQFSICLTVEENDSKPDTAYHYKLLNYSEELCQKGYTVSETLYVRENAGRYSGHCAEWQITIAVTPIN